MDLPSWTQIKADRGLCVNAHYQCTGIVVKSTTEVE